MLQRSTSSLLFDIIPSLSACPSVSAYLFLSASLSLCLCLFLCLSLSLCLSLCFSLSPSLSMSLSRSVSVSVSVSVSLSLSLSLSLPLSLPLSLSLFLYSFLSPSWILIVSFFLCLCLSSVSLPLCLSVSLSVCLSHSLFPLSHLLTLCYCSKSRNVTVDWVTGVESMTSAPPLLSFSDLWQYFRGIDHTAVKV